MKSKCTTAILSVPIALAVIGFGMNAIGQDQSVKPDLSKEYTHISPDYAAQDPNNDPHALVMYDFGPPSGPIMMFSNEGGLVWDNGGPIGSLAMSNVHNPGANLDRRLADDFELSADATIDAVRMGGLFFNGFAGTPPATNSVRVTFYADASGVPGSPVCGPQDITASFVDSGQTFATRIVWDILAKLNSACALGANTRYWVSIQPRNSTDSFFQIESFQPPAFGQQVHVDYPDLGAPAWTPGSSQFADGLQRDKNFQLYGEGAEVEGACCLPKVDGEDADPICVDGITAGECVDLGGSFNSGQVCGNVTCPSQVECPEVDACPACVGDFNDDGVVDGLDLLALLGCWGPLQSGCECVDMNNDNVVDGLDLLTLLGNWGPCPAASGDGGNVINEDEPCGERVNDGCNMDEPAFDELACGDTFCGTAWTAIEFDDLECPGEGTDPGTCGPDGQHCGAQSPDGCWCDSECFDFGDCCIDICDECFGAQEINTRDTDWFNVTVKDAKQRVTFEVHAEFPATASLIWVDADCDLGNVITIATNSGAPKVRFTIEACLQPGVEYKLVVVPTNFTGLPCDGEAQWGDAYTVSMNCEDDACLDDKGACCFGDNCELRDAVTCAIDGGAYLGNGTNCDGDPCVIPEGACCFSDGSCVVVNQDECINDLKGAYRGNGTNCGDMVLVDVGCNGTEQAVPICRNCGAGSQVWCNLQDVCDQDLDNDPFNGGCNYFDPAANEFEAAFEQVCCGDLVGGEIWAIAGQGRDLDWRVLTLNQPTAITLQIEHGFGNANLDAILFIAQAGCPALTVASGAVQTGGGLFTLLEAGTYYVIVTSEFATAGNDLECGTAASQYQLQINCGTQQTNLCENTCSAGFISHPGYPQNTCSCNEDLCTQPVGSTDIGNPNFCCPNICEFCDEGVCDVADCVAAQDVTANINGASVTGNNSNAFGEGALPAGSPSCQWQGLPQNVHNTVWYRFTAPANGAVTIETCGSSTPFQDSVLGLYSGVCGSLVEIGCGGDDCPAPDSPPYYSRIIASGLTPGQTYYISLSNNGGWAGSTPGAYVLDITSP